MAEGATPPDSLVALVEERAVEYDRKISYAFLDTTEEWTFAELAVRARRVAAQLRTIGLEPGERFGILTDDRAAFCDAFFGGQFAGLVPVPLGLGGRPGTEGWTSVLRDRIARFGLAAVATDPAAAPTLADVGTRVIGVDGSAGNPLRDPTAHDIALVQPSSGTTGEPKGVVVSQRGLLVNLTSIGEHWELGPGDSGLSWLPLFHDMGLIGTAINAIFTGATLYQWPTSSFLRSPGRWVELIAQLGVTVTVAPPFALELATRRWRRRGGAADLSRLRHLLVGAERIRPEVLEEFSDCFAPSGLSPNALCPTYGLAEATLAVTAKPRGEPFRVVDDDLHRWTSCGVPIPGVEVRIDETSAEVLVASPGLAEGYLDDPAATAEALHGGRLRTGDCGRLVDGQLLITGRLKEMINRGGIRLAASDFELAVHGVEGVLPDRSVAFGDLGPTGERVVLLAESRQRANGAIVLELRSRLAEVGLAADVVELVPPGFIPRTTSGKLQRAAARDAWLAQAPTAASN